MPLMRRVVNLRDAVVRELPPASGIVPAAAGAGVSIFNYVEPADQEQLGSRLVEEISHSPSSN